MRLRKLEIFGFKSFADRVVVQFDSGVTGIVGPNGCGKSNVVDALRWVMGEQNAKHLRGDSMQDIIFNGSQTRGPLGMAEVILTLENDGNLVPPEYAHFSEIEITRRIYKTGDSEYEINKQACRLRDITELFLGTGVGTKAYSIIEQGRISHIVSAKPDERRQIIEEAAGITKYKARRNAAERKMEATQQNLLRITDVRRELEGRLAALERQAKKAEQYHELQNQIREIELHHAALRFLELTNDLNYLSAQETEQKEIVHLYGLRIKQTEEVIETGKEVLTEQEQKLSLSQAMLYEAENAIALSRQDLSFVKSTLEQKQRQILHIHDETRRLEDRSGQLTRERETYLADSKHIETENARLDQTLQVASAGLQVITQERADKMRLVQDAQNEFLRAAQIAANAQADMQTLGRQNETLLLRKDIVLQETETLKTQTVEQKQRCETLQEEIAGAKAQKIQLEEESLRQKETLARLHESILQTENERQHLGEDAAAKQGRLRSLEEIEQSYDWGAEGLSRIMQDNKTDAVLGLLADFMEVPKEYESLVENVLRTRLEAVVVNEATDALAFSKTLNENQEGRIRFYLNQCDFTLQPAKAAPTKGFFLSKRLKAIKGKDELIERILGRIVVVQNTQEAFELWPQAQTQGWMLVTLDGELFDSDGSIVGGSKSTGAGVLSRKREIREIQTELENLSARRESLEAQLKNEQDKRTELTRTLEETHQQVQNLALSLARSEETLMARQAEAIRLSERVETLIREVEQIETTINNSKDELSNLQTAHTKALETHRLLEEGASSQREHLTELEERLAIKNEEVTNLRVQVASSKERHANLIRAAEQSLSNLDDVRLQMENLTRQLKEIADDQVMLQTQQEQAEKKISESSKERDILAHNLEQQKTVHATKLQDVRQKETHLSNERREMEDFKNNLNTLMLKLQENRLAFQNLSDRLNERYRVRPEEIVCDYHLLSLFDIDVEKRLSELRRSIEQLGSINPNAVEEYNELMDRYTFLKTQSDDLATALSQLESAISKINATTQQRFEEAFNAINERFSQVFPRLFRGGKAWLQMTNPAELLTTGVEIFAQPPGKKLGSIALMSGGEKALTATSLIFSIFLIKPSPFCLLDEVDAPLDEANVDRFSLMVKEMSKLSQFIVITHNKRTMQITDQLYGVTMEQPGISKTVSVKINQNEVLRKAEQLSLEYAPEAV